VTTNVSAASERRVERELAVLAELGEHGLVALRPRNGGDVREVLRRRAEKRRPADVDHLDRLLLGHAALPANSVKGRG